MKPPKTCSECPKLKPRRGEQYGDCLDTGWVIHVEAAKKQALCKE